jgi:enoyl-CoA hydratase/carnithine racemase
MTATLVTEVDGPVLVLRLQREEKRNAIDRALAEAIEAGLDRLEDDPQQRVGLIKRTTIVVSAGTHLAAHDDLRMPRGGEYGVIRRERNKPLIAAVEGLALGGGMEIVLACDLVVASSTASFGLPESLRGLVATCGGLFRTLRTLPPNVAHELLLTGRRLDAERAHRFGLVNEIAPAGEALTRARALAVELCRSAPDSARATLGALREVRAQEESAGWAATERALATVLAGPDSAEGIAAFLERRPPAWTLDRPADPERGTHVPH